MLKMVKFMDYYGFYTGKILDAYEYLGCHFSNGDAVFRTFAPAATGISVIGDFNGWKEEPMKRIYDGNFWECTIKNAEVGMKYKYRIYRKDGIFVDHADPYGFAMERPPMSASVIRETDDYVWHDSSWIKSRSNCKDKPLNVYEVHPGSWRKKNDNSYFTYSELAVPLIGYVKENGYNYIEFMPIGEHPCDNSWGYQQTGFYSPTSRYGEPADLKFLIDYAHKNGVGVILDFVPVHFAVDGYALAEYDGTALYEYPHIDVGISEWGSKNFNHSRGEVQSFLQSCAHYWLKVFHFDGLRIDALSNIIYWHGNKERGINECAVEFIKHMNSSLKELDPSIILIAEDSTAFDGVTRSVRENGLGFDYKWDLGWMNDTLAYFKTHPFDRTRDYHKLTFSMMYFKNEQFLLPLSHDEVVHGKATVLQKMHGEYEMKFHQARAFYMYMFAHPGKKLNFMGNEIGQLREWDESREQDWDILKYPAHDCFSKYIKALCLLYQNTPALYELDYDEKGFNWLDCQQEEKCIYAFERNGLTQKILAVFNFSDKAQVYQLCTGDVKCLKLLIASDDTRYGGVKFYDDNEIFYSDNGFIEISIDPFTGLMYEAVR